MLELGIYTTKELCEALNVKLTSFKSNKQVYLKNYEYIEIKQGRSKSYQITGYKEKQKSTLVQLCEMVARKEIKLPRDKIAESILKFLFQEDRTIWSNKQIAEHLGFEEHTVGQYIKRFRDWGILLKEKPKIERLTFELETGEILSKTFNPNPEHLYTTYKVWTRFNIREEIDEEFYKEMKDFYNMLKSNYIFENFDPLLHGDKKGYKDLQKAAEKDAALGCIAEYGGIPKKAFTKAPTKEAYKVFSEYFNLERPTPKVEDVGKEERRLVRLVSEEEEALFEKAFGANATEQMKIWQGILGYRTMKKMADGDWVIVWKEGEFSNPRSVVGKDPLAPDWDSFPKYIEDEDETMSMVIKRLKEDIKYFLKLRVNNKKLTSQQKERIDLLLRVKSNKLRVLIYEESNEAA